MKDNKYIFWLHIRCTCFYLLQLEKHQLTFCHRMGVAQTSREISCTDRRLDEQQPPTIHTYVSGLRTQDPIYVISPQMCKVSLAYPSYTFKTLSLVRVCSRLCHVTTNSRTYRVTQHGLWTCGGHNDLIIAVAELVRKTPDPSKVIFSFVPWNFHLLWCFQINFVNLVMTC